LDAAAALTLPANLIQMTIDQGLPHPGTRQSF
jgi:hypothetical protein